MFGCLWLILYVFELFMEKCFLFLLFGDGVVHFRLFAQKKRCMSLIFAIFELNLHRFVYLCMSVCGAGTVL